MRLSPLLIIAVLILYTAEANPTQGAPETTGATTTVQTATDDAEETDQDETNGSEAGTGTEASPSELAIFGVGMIAIVTSLLAGVATGFLFGLPKTLEQPEAKGLLQSNSNLDKVSDWLTTILIGLGLVQLGEIAKGVDNLADTIAPGLGGGAGAETVAAGLLIYSAVDGFLIGYLWARIVVSFGLNEAARDLARQVQTQEITPPSVPPSKPELKPAAAPSAGGAT